MLRKSWLMVLCIVMLLPACLKAIEVSEIVITTAVVDREPVDFVNVFPRQNGKLYCFTRILGAEEETVVYHLWYREGQLVSKVVLPVKSSSWRTWSAKQLHEDRPGQWRVEVQDEDEHVLQEITFELR